MLFRFISKPEIMTELRRLTAEDRAEISGRLCFLEEAAGPSESERAVLDEAQARYDANPEAGASWSEVEARLRGRA